MTGGRVFGLETEYGITCAATRPGPPPLDADHAARELFTPVLERYGSTNVFLENGGRLYLDVGSHPEYATAECAALADVLAQDRAGDALMADLAAQTNIKLAQRRVPGRIHLFRNNVDARGNSCGCHENYMLHRDGHFRDIADALVTFFVARQAVVGAGLVTPSGYRLSQRADQMDDAVSAATTRSRPIINTRDEPLATAKHYRRLHVICADSCVSPASTLLKIGSAVRVIGALEQGLDLTDLALAEPLRALRDFCEPQAAPKTHATRAGRSLSAPQILAEIGERVAAYPQPADPLAGRVQQLWEAGVKALQTGDWAGVDTVLDFAIKARLLDEAAERAGHALDFATRRRLELAYHDVTSPLRATLQKTGRMPVIVSAERVEDALRIPPATTRAHLRGRAIAAARAARRDLTADWLNLTVPGTTVTLGDPLETTNPAVDQLIADMEAGG